MAEKIFNTRILNKIDTLENWNASTLPLKKGEIALATVAASAGTGLTEPVVMIKIGEDGVKTFKDLPWNFYAKASDVLAAAKSESALTEFINNVIKNAGLATDGELTVLSDKVTALEGLVGSTAVATQIQNAIDKLNLSETYAAKSHTHKIADVTGLSDSIADAKQAGLDATSALNAYKNTNDAAVSANTTAIAAINNADTGILAQAKTYADGKDAAIAAAKKAGDDAQADVDALEAKVGTVPADKTVVQMISEAQTAATYDDTALKSRVSAVEGLVGDTAVATQISTAVKEEADRAKGVESGLNTRLATVEGDYLKAADKTELTSAIATAKTEAIQTVLGKAVPENFDTLKEVADWIQSDTTASAQLVTRVTNIEKDYLKGADKTALQGEIDALETLVGTLPESATSANVVAYIQEVVDGLKIGDYAKAADLTALATRVTAAESKITALEAAKHTHSNKTVLDGITSEKVAAWDKVSEKANDADLAAIAKSGNVKDLVQTEGDVIIFNCGTASTVI